MAEKTRHLSEKKKRHINRKRLLRLVLIVLLAAAAIVLLLRAFSRRKFDEADLIDEAEQSGGVNVEYLRFDDKILRYSRNGAALLKADGKELWNISYNYEYPKAKLQGSYGMIADIGGTGACIFGKDGITAAIQTNQIILNLAVSGKGTAVLALEDGTTSLLQFYDRSGKKLDISATLEMSLSGFPMDIALSPDGNGLAVAAGAYAGGGLAAQIVFYNFSVGKNETNRLVGYFSYENAIFPELRYMGAGTVAAVGDDRLVLFDMSTENKPQVAQEILFDTSLTAVHIGGAYVSVVRPAADGTGLNLEVYGRSGKKAFAVPIAEVPRYLGDSDDYVIMTSESGLKIWDYKGKLRFEGLLAQDAQTVFAMDRRTLIQPSGGFLYRYRLR